MNSAASAIWRRALLALVVFFVVLSCPLPAEAHLNSTGMGPFYDGLLHFLLSPEDLVPALALALLAGLRGKEYGRAALFVLPGSWMLGGLIGMIVTTVVNPALTAMSFLIVGGLVAGNARLSLRWLTILAALLGIFHGFSQRGRDGTTGNCLRGPSGVDFRCFYPGRTGRRLRLAAPLAVGPHRRPSDRKLDRRQRIAHDRVGRAKSVSL
jgi:hydrogenase/urease accessory protein HupE